MESSTLCLEVPNNGSAIDGEKRCSLALFIKQRSLLSMKCILWFIYVVFKYSRSFLSEGIADISADRYFNYFTSGAADEQSFPPRKNIGTPDRRLGTQ